MASWSWLGDTRGVLAHWDELSNVVRTAVIISVGAFAMGELLQALRVRRGVERVDVRAEIAFRAMFFGAILLWPIGHALAPAASIGDGTWLVALGLMIGWLGLLLRWWSFVSLGKFFTVVLRTSHDQPIVERGPYRVLRHPSYTGLLLVVTGGGLVVGNWISATSAVTLLLAALIYRLRTEERALNATLGDRYRHYAATRARLIPHVW
jgi:protein-S-isoprenylcysteine O-methyltransferase Ste14